MEHRFDRLAKSVSSATTRREALWRLGTGLGIAVLAAVGLGPADPAECAQCCVTQCKTADPPPRGQELALCITTCMETGFVGPSAVCAAVCVEPLI